MTEFDSVLSSGYEEAVGCERIAKEVEAAILKIPGTKGLLPARRFGEPVSKEKVRSNLTLRLLIERNSPQLSVYFGLDAGVAHRQAEQREAIALRRRSLELRTAQLREQNAAAKQQRERAAANPSPWYHRR